ncbi:MAG TPA: sigma-70 family RNA polymerase sigma factor [Candidatus Paceibacterota bacterium]|nr:sigma-70 family RNA polymerase sigma factor [Candidatus Paceibacterota bacterium]
MEQEFIETFTTYGDAIFRFSLMKVSQVELAEDMTQEVFMRYWQYLRDDREITNCRALLYAIANNMAKDWYKKKKAESLDAHIVAGREPAETGMDAEALATYREVLEAAEGLDERDKEVVLLRFVEGLEPRDIAECLGETANAVSVRLNRAAQKLRMHLHI